MSAPFTTISTVVGVPNATATPPSTTLTTPTNTTTTTNSTSFTIGANITTSVNSTLTASLTTALPTTLVSTSANGQAFTTVFTITSVLSPGATITVSPSNDSVSNTSHTGAIIGGAVGGGVALILVFILIRVICHRHRRRQRSLNAIDVNFDMSAQHTGVSTSQGHGPIPASAYTAAYGAATTPYLAESGGTASTPTDRLPNPYSVGLQSTSSAGGSAAHGNRFGVANPDADTGHFVGGAGKSAARLASSKESREVLVHQDGGRVNPHSGGDSEGLDEVPPTYDSLVPEASGSALPRGGNEK